MLATAVVNANISAEQLPMAGQRIIDAALPSHAQAFTDFQPVHLHLATIFGFVAAVAFVIKKF